MPLRSLLTLGRTPGAHRVVTHALGGARACGAGYAGRSAAVAAGCGCSAAGGGLATARKPVGSQGGGRGRGRGRVSGGGLPRLCSDEEGAWDDGAAGWDDEGGEDEEEDHAGHSLLQLDACLLGIISRLFSGHYIAHRRRPPVKCPCPGPAAVRLLGQEVPFPNAQAFMHALPYRKLPLAPEGAHRRRHRGADSSCGSGACADLEDEELQLALMLSASEAEAPAEVAPVQLAVMRGAAAAHAAGWQSEGWQSALEQRLAEQQQQWQAGLWQPGQQAAGALGTEAEGAGMGHQGLLDEEEALALAIRLSEEEALRGVRREGERDEMHENHCSPSASRLGLGPSGGTLPPGLQPRSAPVPSATVLPPSGRGRGRGRGRLPEWAEPEAAPRPNQGLCDDEALALALRLSAVDARYDDTGDSGSGGGGSGSGGSDTPVTQESLAEWATVALAPLVEGGGVAPDVLAEIVLSLETDNEVDEYCNEFLGRSAATSAFVADICSRRRAYGSAR